MRRCLKNWPRRSNCWVNQPATGRSAAAGSWWHVNVKAALVEAGYWPQLQACLVCRRPVTDRSMRFSVRAGGVMCGPVQEGLREWGGGMLSGKRRRDDGSIGPDCAGVGSPAAADGIAGDPPERAGDAKALAMALQLLLAQVEGITDMSLRTGAAVEGIFSRGGKEGGE